MAPSTKFVHVQFIGPRLLQGTLEARIEAVMASLPATVLQRSPRWLPKDDATYDNELYRWVEIAHQFEDEEDLMSELYCGFGGLECETFLVEIADSASHEMTWEDEEDDDTA